MKPDIIKQREANERQEVWDALSPKEKLAELDERLGRDTGAVKQRVNLLSEIDLEKAIQYAEAYGAEESVIVKLKERLENERNSSS